MEILDKGKIHKCIEGDTKEMIAYAQIVGEYLGKRLKRKKDGGEMDKDESLSTSQIRNIFSEIKEMEMRGFKENDTEKRLLLLKPKLAYAGRPGAKKGTRVLRDILTSAIDDVLEEGITKDKFENFCKFFEAILAYHRAAGGN